MNLFIGIALLKAKAKESANMLPVHQLKTSLSYERK
jgi:hypothetical protein